MLKVEFNSNLEELFILIYIRKSKKLEYGVTFETQVDRCKREAKKYFGDKAEIKIFPEENKSGDDATRPEYNKMKNFIRNNKKCIVYSYAENRLVRDVEEGVALSKFLRSKKVDLYIYQKGNLHIDTPEGLSYFISNCNNAETELNVTKKNQAENAFRKAELSIKTGSQAPFGYTNNSREIFINDSLKKESYYSINEIEIYNVIRIYELYLKHQSISKVTKILHEDNVCGKYGNDICKTTVRSILTNPANVKTNEKVVDYFYGQGFEIGEIEFGKGGNTYGKKSKAEFLNEEYRKKHFFTLHHDGVIEADKWLEVQRILKNNLKLAPKKGKSRKSALDNLLKCRCGADMKIASIKEEKVYYCCSVKCGNKNVNGTNLEKMLFEDIVKINKSVLIQNMRSNYSKVLKKVSVGYKNLNKEKSNLDTQYNKLVEKLIILESNNEARVISLTRAIDKKYLRIVKVNEKLELIDKMIPNINNKVEEYTLSLNNKSLRDILFEEADLDTRKNILRMIIKEMIWDSDTKTVYIKKNK